MMKNKLSVKTVWLPLLLFLVFYFPDLRAQIYFGITPIRFELKAKAGSQQTEVIQVRNNSSRPIRVRAYPENWFLGEDGSRNFIGRQPAPYSRQEWLRVNPSDFRLLPGEIKSVRFTISVPEGAEDGSYHAAVSFEQVPESPPGGRIGQVAFTGKIVAAVYVVVGRVNVDGRLEDLVFEPGNGHHHLRLKIVNAGRFHFRLKGEVIISTAEGRKVTTVEIPDEPVLPETRRWLSLNLKENLPSGRYLAEARLDIGRNELLGLRKELEIK
ncbi:MAG: hypothetical protein ACUVR0_10165 [Candidatus Aminicenantales bacterium]